MFDPLFDVFDGPEQEKSQLKLRQPCAGIRYLQSSEDVNFSFRWEGTLAAGGLKKYSESKVSLSVLSSSLESYI